MLKCKHTLHMGNFVTTVNITATIDNTRCVTLLQWCKYTYVILGRNTQTQPKKKQKNKICLTYTNFL